MKAGIKQAVIFAGGRGERLRPLTDDRPKPMILINGKPFLEYLLEMLKKSGIEEVVMLLGYKHEKITEYFGDGSGFGVDIKYSILDVTDETGTRLRTALPLLADEFFLLYCDNYWPVDLKKMTEFFREKNVLGMLTAYNNTDGGGEYGFKNNVRAEDDGLVTYYGPFTDDKKINVVDIGFFIMKKEVVSLIPQENVSFQNSVLPQLIERKQLAVYRTDLPYYAITSPAQVSVLEKIFVKK